MDYDRQFALVAEAPVLGGATEIAGVVRLSRIHATNDRGLTLTIADAWQRQGIGAQLVHSAVRVARGEKVEHVVAELAWDNKGMRELLEDEGFAFDERGDTLIATLTV